MLLAQHQQCSCSIAVPLVARAAQASLEHHPQRGLKQSQGLKLSSSQRIGSSTLHNALARSSRHLRCQRQRARAMVGDEELVEGIETGTKVRVKTPVTVYHSPKLGDFNLEGKEGEVMDVVSLYKGKQTSANLPYKVTFMIPQEEGKDIKLVAHLSAPEIEVVQ